MNQDQLILRVNVVISTGERCSMLYHHIRRWPSHSIPKRKEETLQNKGRWCHCIFPTILSKVIALIQLQVTFMSLCSFQWQISCLLLLWKSRETNFPIGLGDLNLQWMVTWLSCILMWKVHKFSWWKMALSVPGRKIWDHFHEPNIPLKLAELTLHTTFFVTFSLFDFRLYLFLPIIEGKNTRNYDWVSPPESTFK